MRVSLLQYLQPSLRISAQAVSEEDAAPRGPGDFEVQAPSLAFWRSLRESFLGPEESAPGLPRLSAESLPVSDMLDDSTYRCGTADNL